MFDLDEEEIERYSRHLLIKEISMHRQIKALKSAVCLYSNDMLNSIIALYCSSMGVRNIIIEKSESSIGFFEKYNQDFFENLKTKIKKNNRKNNLSGLEWEKDINVSLFTYKEKIDKKKINKIIEKTDKIILFNFSNKTGRIEVIRAKESMLDLTEKIINLKLDAEKEMLPIIGTLIATEIFKNICDVNIKNEIEFSLDWVKKID